MLFINELNEDIWSLVNDYGNLKSEMSIIGS